MKHWLWVLVALTVGCFNDPPNDGPLGETDASEGGGSLTDIGSAGVLSTTSAGFSDTNDSNSNSNSNSNSGSGSGNRSESSESGETGSSSTSSDTEPSGPTCGDGIVEGDEHCDGDDPQGAACLDDCTITCLDHFQDCDEMPAGGCEIDTASDADNCGACGRVCGSGVCENSECAPAAIAEGIGTGPMRITRVEDTFIFDESGFGRILRWDLGEEQVQELVSDALTGSFQRVAVAGDSVFWQDGGMGSTQRVSLAGGEVEFLFSINDGGSPFASETHLYYPTTTFVDGLQVSTLLRAAHASPALTEAVAPEVPGTICQVTQAAGRIVFSGTSIESPVRSILPAGGPVQLHPILSTDACNRPMFGVGPMLFLYGRLLEAGPFGLIAHNLSTNTSTMVIQEASIGELGDYFVSAHGILADVGDEVRLYDTDGSNPIVVAETPGNSLGRYLDDEFVLWTEVVDNTWTLFINDRP